MAHYMWKDRMKEWLRKGKNIQKYQLKQEIDYDADMYHPLYMIQDINNIYVLLVAKERLTKSEYESRNQKIHPRLKRFDLNTQKWIEIKITDEQSQILLEEHDIMNLCRESYQYAMTNDTKYLIIFLLYMTSFDSPPITLYIQVDLHKHQVHNIRRILELPSLLNALDPVWRRPKFNVVKFYASNNICHVLISENQLERKFGAVSVKHFIINDKLQLDKQKRFMAERYSLDNVIVTPNQIFTCTSFNYHKCGTMNVYDDQIGWKCINNKWNLPSYYRVALKCMTAINGWIIILDIDRGTIILLSMTSEEYRICNTIHLPVCAQYKAITFIDKRCDMLLVCGYIRKELKHHKYVSPVFITSLLLKYFYCQEKLLIICTEADSCGSCLDMVWTRNVEYQKMHEMYQNKCFIINVDKLFDDSISTI